MPLQEPQSAYVQYRGVPLEFMAAALYPKSNRGRIFDMYLVSPRDHE